VPVFKTKSFLLSELLCCAALACSGVHAASDADLALELVEQAAREVRTDPEASRRNAEAALQALARAPDPDLEIRARLLLCDYLSERDRPAAELQVARATELLPFIKRSALRSGLYDCRGTIMETAGDNAAANELFERAVQIASDAQDDEMLANALYSRGYLLGVQGQYAAGLADLKRSQGIYERIQLSQHSLTALNGIAILYNRMGDYAQARDMYLQALHAQRAAGLKREQAVTLHNLGRARENLQEWQDAKAAFDESLQISVTLQYERGQAYGLRGLAAVANAQNEPQLALELLARAEALQTPDARLSGQIELARGIALHKLGRLSESARSLEHALSVFEGANSLHELRATHAAMAVVYADLGTWPKAYASLAKSKDASEQLLQNQIDQRFATLKVEFDTATKEQQNELLTRENSANQKALASERRARALQRIAIALTAILAAVLAALVVHQKKITRRMRRLAMTDELTGLPNRRAVLRKLEAAIAGNQHCALLIIDIDHFKAINDRYGHSEGDHALKLVAQCLAEQLGPTVSIGRLGGEEFVVVAPSFDIAAATDLAEQFRRQVMTLDCSAWLADRKITVSTGLTICVEGDTASSMLQRADAALYDAKRAGRNCVRANLANQSNAINTLAPVHLAAAGADCAT
jgi:diguanylate cyclase (GGDEF)-like protein